MGKDPGVPNGYAMGPAARVGDRETAVRKRTNHMFAGPDYSIVHPGIFPHNTEAQELATLREWLTFDVDAGWGTDEFEEQVTDDTEFPSRWVEPNDRYDAADILRDNLDLLAEMGRQRLQVLQAGYQLGEVVVERADDGGVKFRVEVKNGTNGHNVPTGFDAERVVWLNTTVTDNAGVVVYESGDLDPNGDVRDSHSVYVHNGAVPPDDELFSLQSRFLVRMVRGGEREQVLAVNYSPDPLPFLRPSTSSTVLTGRPVGARKHRQTLPTLGAKWATYTVDRDALAGSTGPYFANVKIKSAMVPVNLIHEIEGVGFDYGMSAREVADAVVAGHVVVQERDIDLSRGGALATSPPAPRRGGAHDAVAPGAHEDSRLSDEALPLQLAGFPNRPKPLLELGTPFLGTGRIGRGFTLPGGAVWTPSFLLFGQFRTGVSVVDSGDVQDTQWANRLDLFGNLYLTGTERVVFGLRPTDQTDPLGGRQFSGYRHQSIDEGGGGGAFTDQFNFDWDTVTHLFFEGDLGELLPNLDLDDRRGLDLGLSVGRQPINFQEGMLINDFVDAVGMTQNNLRPGGVVNLRFTGLYGWNQINRNTPSDRFFVRNLEGDRAHLVGAFTEIDWRSTTAAFDVVYVRGGEFTPRGALSAPAAEVTAGDGVYAGVSFVGRPGSGAFNLGLRALTSVPVGGRSSSRKSPGRRTARRIFSTATRSMRSTTIAPRRWIRPGRARWRAPVSCSPGRALAMSGGRCLPPPAMWWVARLVTRCSSAIPGNSCWWRVGGATPPGTVRATRPRARRTRSPAWRGIRWRWAAAGCWCLTPSPRRIGCAAPPSMLMAPTDVFASAVARSSS